MCYSAQVIQLARKLERQFGVKLDYDESEKLFFRRLDDPSITVSRGFENNFLEPATAQGERIKTAIEEHRSRTAAKLERDLFSQKTRLVNAERALKIKETKKHREDIRIAAGKIDSLASKIIDSRRSAPDDRDNRIFPMAYAGVIVKQHGEYILTPMRYACRPAGKPSFIDRKFPGLYNARSDNLEKFWSGQFGRHHGIMVVESFYENVQLHVKERRCLAQGEKPRNLVLQFTPSPPQWMLIACIWSHWTGGIEPEVRGFAAITDDPPADVAAAGHDRCIINLQSNHIDAWLTPQGRKTAELHAILEDRAVSTYGHIEAQAA